MCHPQEDHRRDQYRDIYAMEAIAGGPAPRQWHFNDIILSAYTRGCNDDSEFHNYIDVTVRSSISEHRVSTHYITEPAIDEVEEVVEVVTADDDEEEDDAEEEQEESEAPEDSDGSSI